VSRGRGTDALTARAVPSASAAPNGIDHAERPKPLNR
jgi:hypothetical protein